MPPLIRWGPWSVRGAPCFPSVNRPVLRYVSKASRTVLPMSRCLYPLPLSLLTAALAASSWTNLLSRFKMSMANDSRVNPKMVFAILTDSEIEELKETAIRQRNFYAANLLRWEADERSQPKAEPVQSPLVRCKDARVMLGGRCILELCERAGWLTPVTRGKRLTLFKRNDIEAAQLRIASTGLAFDARLT
jgi:hypothetical protein